MYAWAQSLPDLARRTVSKIPFRNLFLAVLPYLMYLLLFSNYKVLRKLLGLTVVPKPNMHFCPSMELLIFRCFPHQILAKFANPVFDFLAAIPYLIHFPLPVFMIIHKLVDKRRRSTLLFYVWIAGWCNFIGVFIQFVFPTAPPWYMDSVVFSPLGSELKAGYNEAGFHRLDAILGFPLFHKLYSASPVKFGAFPSLHVAWPTIVLVSDPWVSERFAKLHVLWITWAALYSNHHYGVDAIGAIVMVFTVRFFAGLWSPFGNHLTSGSCRNSSYTNLLQV